jgi:hypothetical protein
LFLGNNHQLCIHVGYQILALRTHSLYCHWFYFQCRSYSSWNQVLLEDDPTTNLVNWSPVSSDHTQFCSLFVTTLKFGGWNKGSESQTRAQRQGDFQHREKKRFASMGRHLDLICGKEFFFLCKESLEKTHKCKRKSTHTWYVNF